ncbi:polysaccharide deacetylase family protein [Flavobacteriaceae bacterium]|nr:polysaccharide deacetylase family protein [Flavobacteriaceae bacterium]
MILVYSHKNTPRLVYVLNVICTSILKIPFRVVTSVDDFKKSNNCYKLNYSSDVIENSYRIEPSALLFETTICKQLTDVTWVSNIPYFFKTETGFDILAASFWMLTRYEEYLDVDTDNHGRYKAENSLAYKEEFLQLPVVNIWVQELKDKLSLQKLDVEFPTSEFSFLNTFDIDTAYAFKGKGFKRAFLRFCKCILSFRFTELKDTFKYLFNGDDFYDTYPYILDKSKNIENLFFFLIAKVSPFDKGLSIKKNAFKKLIQKISKTNTVGIHPSYVSFLSKDKIVDEKNTLAKAVGAIIDKSRQHYLRLKLPESYNVLMASDVKEDYSMGYASQIGFRAGVCTPYSFYDLQKEEEQGLKIVPFQIMDVTLNVYLKLTPSEAIDQQKKIINSVKAVNGTFVSLWHNSSLTERDNWKGWRLVYEAMLHSVK